MDSRRAESFSDGVFAVAITVLIFNLLPIGREALSYRVLASAWPQYAAYVVSFLTIGIMWMNHHTMFGARAAQSTGRCWCSTCCCSWAWSRSRSPPRWWPST